MEEVSTRKSWTEELASLVEDTGIRYTDDQTNAVSTPSFELRTALEGENVESESFVDQMKGFVKAWGEIVVELGLGFRDVVVQTVLTDDSVIVKNVRKVKRPCGVVVGKLSVLNEFLPEDRHPAHAWPVILSVFLVVVAVLSLSFKYENTPVPLVQVHPPSATRILLPDGRNMSYHEQGVSGDIARYSLIAPHSFLSSRLAGIPGIKLSLLAEFGVRLVSYDLPGFGESDPHPNRTLHSSAMDLFCLAEALEINKFWVLGYSSGSMHAWAALKYIPDKIAGAAMIAPMVNPFDPGMTKEEKLGTWDKWTRRRKLLYYLARRFPRFLRPFYRRTLLSGKHGPIDKWLSLSLSEQDKAVTEDPVFKEFWQRDVEESIRQGNVKPFVEEVVLQVSNWPFSLMDLQVQKKCPEKGLFHWFKFMASEPECELVGFLEPIHIWQGIEDLVVPTSMTDYVARVLPNATVHKLPDHGHLSYFYFCDKCHRTIMSTLFGEPQGPIGIPNQAPLEVTEEEESFRDCPQEVLVPQDCVTLTHEYVDRSHMSKRFGFVRFISFGVMIVFQDDETNKSFQFNLVVGSWFSQIIQAHNDFVIDERVIWVEVEGVPCKWWSRNTFSRIASIWGTLLNGEELEEEGYHSNRICIRTKLKTVVFDSFKMVYRGMTCWVRAIEVPGWVPDFEEDGEEGYDVNDGSHEDDMYGGVPENLKDVEGESDREEVPKTNFEEVPDKSIFEGNSVRQNDVHSEDPFGIYDVLNKKTNGKNIDDKHKDSLKYPPGFKPTEEGDVPVEKVDNWSDENRVNDGNETAKDLWDALERQMHGSEYGEQDRKAAILYEYETFKANEREQLLDTYLRYLQGINDLKKRGYKKDNCELNYKFLNNLQPEWKQYATLMRQTKNLMDINIDAFYNIIKQNQGDVNDALGYKKKVVVVTSDPLALVAEKTKVSKRKEKVVVFSDSERSGADDFSKLKKITALLAKAFNRRKFYSKPTNNNLRTSSTSQSANKKQEFVKSNDKKEDKKADEKKRDMSKVKCITARKNDILPKTTRKQRTKLGWSPVVILIRKSMQTWSSWLKLKRLFQNKMKVLHLLKKPLL
nr:alpha/beta hydrolases superfamily protein [Tanacetum cinerariifolium]